jgi:hypothetical protein
MWDPHGWGELIMCCHVACLWWGGLFRCCHLAPFLLLCTNHTLPGGIGADVASEVAQYDLATCLGIVWRGWMVAYHMAWPWGEVDHWLTATCHCGGAHLSGDLCQDGPTCWRWPMRECHVALSCWTGPIRRCHVAHPLSSSILYYMCFSYLVCTQNCCCPQVVPRVALIKSQSLINPFNLFYLL